MPKDLKDKRVLVTGSSTGIGAAVAKGFAAAGARVVVHYHASAAAAEKVVADIMAAGGAALALSGGAKAFVSSITRNLARELAPSGIRVNAVAPGVIMTPFHERSTSLELLERFRKTIPMGRIGVPEECVGAYLFLASPAMSGYITGQTIEVNGGQLMP
jgi:3-oxoacyl-[acyl-carrier protein] reductase